MLKFLYMNIWEESRCSINRLELKDWSHKYTFLDVVSPKIKKNLQKKGQTVVTHSSRYYLNIFMEIFIRNKHLQRRHRCKRNMRGHSDATGETTVWGHRGPQWGHRDATVRPPWRHRCKRNMRENKKLNKEPKTSW